MSDDTSTVQEPAPLRRGGPARESPDPVAERREVTCALRDGTRLRTVLLVPHGTGPWPALLTRRPHDVTREEHDGTLDVGRLVVTDGVQRGSARSVDPVTGLGDRRPVEPDQEQEFVVDLWSTAHTFLPGHRVRIDIAPSSSPRWDVGRNAFDPAGATTEPTAAEYTIRHGAAHPSRLVLQVVTTAPR
ncbi:CocE/NonD family hydrolase C-terminal non-catalytic domain-containing protein [Streptomyces sp. NTH33]|uniref:CocE/NonD family hydrolase C-terminal non-catalytic domain-containing protein n=1 Tax=Streptomyces sp. NTH33 TaxID=1735453 RepID=UPI0021AC359E|nr:CocE/NonD family hydrolase C-terminal non-catalytic domain-containing protein [Streptomyces sp. NTH33]